MSEGGIDSWMPIKSDFPECLSGLRYGRERLKH